MWRNEVGRHSAKRLVWKSLAALAVFAGVLVEATTVCLAEEKCKDNRLRIWVFGGQVVDNFAASARDSYVNAEDQDNRATASLMGGIEFEYDLIDSLGVNLQLFGQFIHSKRTAQVKSDSTGQTTDGLPSQDDLFDLIRSATTLEWLGGLKLALNGENTGFYFKGQAGFIRFADAADDVLDNLFMGFGIQARKGPFCDSFVEVGVGKTDLFPKSERWPRLKVGAALEYDQDEKPFEWFLEGWLDSDSGDGSDDIQIYFGVACAIDKVLGSQEK